MIRKLGPLAAILMLTAAFAAGCGGDDKSDSTSDAPATTAAATTTSGDTTTTGTTTGNTATDEQLDKAIEACKESVDSNPQISADLKDDVKTICDKVRSNDPEELKKATRDVCETIVKKSLPAGDTRDTALQACASAGD